MIDGREPNYICLDTRAFKILQRLSDSERLTFYDGLYAVYLDNLNGTQVAVFPDNVAGDLLRQAAETLIDGFNTYMRRVNANLTGKKTTDNPMGTQWVPNAPQSNKDQYNQDQYNQDQINQIKLQLKAEGYSGSEIDKALTRCGGKRVRNLTAYIRQSIDNVRQNGKRVPGQEYEQRDYSGVQAELIAQQDHEMEEYIRHEREAGKDECKT